MSEYKNRPWFIATLATALATLVLGIYLSKYDFQVGALFATPKYLGQKIQSFPSDIPLFENSGHDGALIWSVGRNPLRPNLDEVGHHFERFLFPMANFIFSFGQEEWLKWSTPFVNLLSTFIIAYLLAILLIQRNISPLWAILLAVGPSSVMALRFNISNQFYLMLCCWSYLNYLEERPKAFTLSTTLAFCTVPLSFGINAVAAFLAGVRKQNLNYIWILPLPILATLIYKAWLIEGLNYDIKYFFNDALGENSIFSLPLLAMFKGSGEYLSTASFPRKVYYFASYFIFLYFLVISCFKIFKERKLNFISLIVIGYSFSALCTTYPMSSGGLLQFARLFPVFPLLLLEHDPSSKLHKFSQIAIIATFLIAQGWILFSPIMT